MFEQRLHVKAQPASLNFAMSDELVRDFMCKISGDSATEAETDFVDAHDLAAQIDQRPSRVASVNGSIMSNPADQPADILAIQTHLTAEHSRHDHFHITDNAKSHRLRKGHGTPHRQHGISHNQFGGIAKN